MGEEFAQLLSYARQVAKKTDEVIYSFLEGEPKELYDASIHLIKAGGKRLRPLVTVLSGKIFGLPEDLGIYGGASVEIMHNFTLVHDDIMDQDELRRGVPTVHKLWGIPLAILAGDLLFAKAFQPLLYLKKKGIPSDRILRAIEELDNSAIILSEGQAMDMEFERRDYVSIDEYLSMIYKKTAALFKTCVSIGAILAGAPEEDIDRIKRFAENVGIAFQIRDDQLGLLGDEKQLGKPVYSDLREGKKTILVIYALDHLKGEEKEHVLKVLGNKMATKEEFRIATELIVKSGALEYSNELIEKFMEEGLRELESIESSDQIAKKMLRQLALYVTRRKY